MLQPPRESMCHPSGDRMQTHRRGCLGAEHGGDCSEDVAERKEESEEMLSVGTIGVHREPDGVVRVRLSAARPSSDVQTFRTRMTKNIETQSVRETMSVGCASDSCSQDKIADSTVCKTPKSSDADVRCTSKSGLSCFLSGTDPYSDERQDDEEWEPEEEIEIVEVDRDAWMVPPTGCSTVRAVSEMQIKDKNEEGIDTGKNFNVAEVQFVPVDKHGRESPPSVVQLVKEAETNSKIYGENEMSLLCTPMKPEEAALPKSPSIWSESLDKDVSGEAKERAQGRLEVGPTEKAEESAYDSCNESELEVLEGWSGLPEHDQMRDEPSASMDALTYVPVRESRFDPIKRINSVPTNARRRQDEADDSDEG